MVTNYNTEAPWLQLMGVGTAMSGLEDMRCEDHSLNETVLELAKPNLISVRTEIIQIVIGTVVKWNLS